MIFGLCVALVVLVLDQLSKLYVSGIFESPSEVLVVGSYFNIIEAWNTGVSFSMLDGGGFWGAVMLSTLSAVVVAFLLIWLGKEKSRVVQVALGMIIGGAAGNVIDRIRFGAVYDFLDLHYENLHWPVFNVADVFICLGAFLIIVYSIINRHEITLKEGGK